MNLLSKIIPRFQADLAGSVLTLKSSIGSIERYLLHCHSFPIRRNSVLSIFTFSLFINIHDWTEAKHDCKPFGATDESSDAKESYSCLYIISIEIVRDSVSRDHGAQWSGVEYEKQKT